LVVCVIVLEISYILMLNHLCWITDVKIFSVAV
jgi:hypothetical protein